MKNLLYLVAIVSSFLFICCEKNCNREELKDSSIVGKWMLVETLADPGDGSGKWTAVDVQGKYFLKFNADGRLEGNSLERFGNLTRYKVLNDSSVNFIYADGREFALRYKIRRDSLTITGGCIEACGSRFIRKQL